MPAWLGPAIDVGLGLLGVGGRVLANREQRLEARRNRQFQERMSSTAAQRSQADYAAAGLNPLLAYDRPASSPGGSMADIEDVVAPGVSSAMAAKRMRADLELLREQTEKTRNERRSAEVSARIASNTEVEATQTAIAKLRQEREVQPFQLELAKALAELQKANVPGAQAEAQFWNSLGKAGPWAKGLAPLLRLIRPR